MKQIFTLFIFLASAVIMTAQDTVTVQTLNFDMITRRRGIFKFPDDPSQFRKILMKYTLKCDPQTTHDQYACGEWDYLTFNIVYHPTGRYDSTRFEHPYFRLGWEAPDSLEYTSVPYYNVNQIAFYNRIVENVSDEKVFNIGSGNDDVQLSGDKGRIQFILSTKELKDYGLVKGDFNRMALNVKVPANTIYRFGIRLKNAPTGIYNSFVNFGFDTVYYFEVKFDTPGWKIFEFLKPFNWTGFSGLMFDLSYQKISGTDEPVLSGFPVAKSARAEGEDRYMQFGGLNDYVEIKNKINQLYGSSKFTFEGWVNVKDWRSWNRIMGNEKTEIQLGDKTGQIYCFVRNSDNTYGNAQSAITLNDWYHIAMVFDGTKQTNEEKLKLFINGQPRSMVYSGVLPSSTSNAYSPFSITGAYSAVPPLMGNIDEVRLWNEAINDSVIAGWYNRKIDNTHPSYGSLSAYYSFDSDTGVVLSDDAGGNHPGALLGSPQWMDFSPMMLFKNVVLSRPVPEMKLYQGTYTSYLGTFVVNRSIKVPPVSIIKYKIENYKPVPFDISYVWRAGYSYKFDTSGKKIDSVFHPKENTINNYKLSYYGEPFEVKYPYEIGRYITPYGINLDLGPDGFTWYYDVTDYAPILKGNVDFEAGNQQELIDVKFLFIKGTPPRDVLSIKEPWGQYAACSYKDLSGDLKLSATKIQLNPDAKQFKLTTRLTGHGHASNDGNYPHCCEWKDNTHYLLVNGVEFANWHIWQTNDCALNPVYPQGGTWPGSREGWCPGDIVKDNSFFITDKVSNSEVTLDYDITKVPDNNLGMGNGNYIVSMQLFEYGDFKFNTDAEIYNVIMPSSEQLHSRVNPVCANPVLIVRNNGRSSLTELNFRYFVSGGKEEIYNWKGDIKPNELMNITLPLPGSQFWLGDGKNRFNVAVSSATASSDENPENNTFVTDFIMPDLLPEDIVIEYKTNLRPRDYTYQIRDVYGEVVLEKNYTASNSYNYDTLRLPKGCYTFELVDAYNMGLSYWAYPDQGSGYLRFVREGKPIKTFNSDFGHSIRYSFNIGDITYIKENDANNYLELFPNPAGDDLKILANYELGNSDILITDIEGRILRKENDNINDRFQKSLNISDILPGVYFVRIQNDKYNIVKKFVKK